MKKSMTLSFSSKRAAMLLVLASVSVGALAQAIIIEGSTAIINGNSEQTVSSFMNGVKVSNITCNRTITPGKCATIMFPFEITAPNSVAGGTFYKFECVDGNEFHGWRAKMVE